MEKLAAGYPVRSAHAWCGTTIFALVAGLGPLLAPARAGDSPARERFLREYPAACERLAARYGEAGRWVIIETDIDIKKIKINNSKFNLFISGDKARVDKEIAGEAGAAAEGRDDPGPRGPRSSSLVGSGDRYFVVRRPRPDAPYSLVRTGRGRPLQLANEVRRFAEAPISILGSRLADFIALPNVVVGAFTEVDVGGRTLIKVDFACKPLDPRKYQISSGWFRLDPGRGWTLESYHVETSKSQEYSNEITYQGDSLYPTKVHTRFRNPGDSIETESTLEFEAFRPGPVPEREFTLPAFGLPEADRPVDPAPEGHAAP